jgi:hypothetical protein
MFFPTDDNVSFATNGGERMRITTAGFVGIGTTAPTQLLDVNGSINVTSTSGNIYLGTNQRIYLGDGSNASIYFNGTHLVMEG